MERESDNMTISVSRLLRSLRNDSYRKNPNKHTTLDSVHLSALSVGAINSEQVMYYCDSLTTGAPSKELKQYLGDYYGVIDSKTALETLDWLQNEGHRHYFESIQQAEEPITTIISSNIGALWPELDADGQRCMLSYARNLVETIDLLIEHEYIHSLSDLKKMSIAAWDMGRLVMVARSCFDCGYITEEECWEYIFNAYQRCKEVYSDWDALAKGYVVGRAMWGGNNMTISGILSIASDLRTNAESPWKQIKF